MTAQLVSTTCLWKHMVSSGELWVWDSTTTLWSNQNSVKSVLLWLIKQMISHSAKYILGAHADTLRPREQGKSINISVRKTEQTARRASSANECGKHQTSEKQIWMWNHFNKRTNKRTLFWLNSSSKRKRLEQNKVKIKSSNGLFPCNINSPLNSSNGGNTCGLNSTWSDQPNGCYWIIMKKEGKLTSFSIGH